MPIHIPRALLLLLVFFAPAALAQPAVTVAAPELLLTGLPLELAIELDGAPRQEVTVLVDGRPIGVQSVALGSNALRFEDLDLASGGHELEVRSGVATVHRSRIRVLSGWLSLLPPLLAIGLALITRDVLISLFLGIFGGAVILFLNPFVAFVRSIDGFIAPALVDGDRVAIIMFTILLGGMVGLVTKNGGTHGIVERLKPFASTRRRGQVATWLMGVTVFFDDYANTLIVGPTMRPITDKLRISREKLAYIVDSTAAPVVCLFPISTWVGFEIGLIGDAFKQLGLPYDPYTIFVATIPYRFYPIFALILVLTLALSRLDFGPMRRAETRAMERGLLLDEDAEPIADYSSEEVEPPADIPKRARNAILPILTVVGVTILGLYVTGRSAGATELREILAAANSYHALLWASLSGVLVALVLPLAQRLLKLREGMTAMMAGFKAMFMALVVLTLAWSLSDVCSALHTADYLVGLTSGNVSPVWLPALVFVLSAATAFATGSSWGTMGILEPLVIPICHSLSLAAGHEVGSEPYMLYMLTSISSVLAGSIWGDHCSPISDTTILSSMATGCDHIAHVRTQLPYALTVGFLAILVGSIPAALGTPAWVSLLVGVAILVGGVLALGRRQRAVSTAASG